MNALRRLKRSVIKMKRYKNNNANESTKVNKVEKRKTHYHDDEASLKSAKNFTENVKNKTKNKSNAREKVC